MNFKCRVCGSEDYKFMYDYHSGYVYECDGCSTMFTSPKKITLNRQLKVKYLDNYDLDNWGEIDYQKMYDSGADVRAAIDKEITVYPYMDAKTLRDKDLFVKIPFGICVQSSHTDTDVKIYNRSGTSGKNGLFLRNCTGVVDNAYTGQCMGYFVNLSRKPYTIQPGEKIAQIVIENRLDVDIIRVDELDQTERGEDGFGSTGK